ncbi:RING finger protein ETP1-like protein [Psilocybe cubensis]|uniref:Zf-UBP-domain-containing protein n=2 Tax=Psilocybe cubensis TaxID=181762 RepID=A0A8H8CHG8_PSICU|nr:RING finger protein ETP1-like protein [Psilocybe cubensis]KAH9479491.1 RING finger protein ETP1-like protein [Psilocybe cubensis]
MRRGYHIRISLDPEPKTLRTNLPDLFIPATLFQPLPSHSAKSTVRRNTLSRPIQKKKDYRFGPIAIDWVDFDHMRPMMLSAKERPRSRGPAEATFVPHTRSKSGTTNLPEGTVHIFRDGSSKPTTEELEAKVSKMALTDPAADSDGIMLGVLAVPSWMTPSDFLEFVAPAVDGIAHLRIIRDFAPNRSMVVIKFPNPADAAEFSEAYNGKPFNSMQPEICHVVHVLSVTIDVEDVVSQTISRIEHAQGNVYELPTCPVCLERMDSAVTGLITVPCSHTFHCACLSKWGDSRCPVCRYSQTLLSSHPTSSTSTRTIPFADPLAQNQSSCTSCASRSNLWICLICGNVGCGRYGQAHAQAHYQATTHLYALELETQRVWDYAGDGYVHRLIQNKADGKLVELPSAASSVAATPREGGLGPSQADALSAEKIEAIGIEYSYLLTSQLDSQRSFYEEQSQELKSQVDELKTLVEKLSVEFKKEKERNREEEVRLRKAEEERIAQLLKDKAKAENRAEKVAELARRLEKELREERAVSEGLMKNLSKMRERAELADKDRDAAIAEVKDLKEQLRDVFFSLEAQKAIEQGGGIESEAAGGSIAIPLPESTSTTDAKKKKARKR